MDSLFDQRMAGLAATQHGAFSRRQAMDLGAGYAVIRRRVLAGRWVARTASTYTIGGSQDTWEQRVQIALLDRPDGVLSGSTAAALHAIPGFVRSRVELTLPFTASGRSKTFTVHRCRHFDDLVIEEIAGFRTMSIEDTLFDLARRISPHRLQATIEESIVRRLTSLADVESALLRRIHSNCPSRTPVIAALEQINGTVTESALERSFKRIAETAGLPRMARQVPAPWWESGPLRVDFTIPSWRLIIELDGRSWHTRQSDFEKDRARDNHAVAAGWRVLRFTYRMVKDRPEAVLNTIRQSGTRAA